MISNCFHRNSLRFTSKFLSQTTNFTRAMSVVIVKDSEVAKKKLNDAANDKLTIGWFTATWCGPCRSVAPKVEEMAKKYQPDGVEFLKVDVDDHADLAEEVAIRSVPTFIFVKNGAQKEQISGADPVKIEELLVKYK